MWNPNFQYEERKIVSIKGYERSFCIKTHSHRGCPNNFGLVLGIIDNISSECLGIAFKLNEKEVCKAIKYLDNRELGEGNYNKKLIYIKEINDNALVYLPNESSELYSTLKCPIKQAQIIKNAKGHSGSNLDYYINTVSMIKSLGGSHEPIFDINKYL
jgi:cation transport protein ChaC